MNQLFPAGFESRAIILDGIAEFEKYTCLQFVPQTTETDYIIFTGRHFSK
jgi:hypothetical protein